MESHGVVPVGNEPNPLADAVWGCSRLRDRLGAERVAVWVLNDLTATLSPAISAGARVGAAEHGGRQWTRTPVDAIPLFGEVIANRRSQVVEDAAADPRFPADFVRDFAIGSVRLEALVTDRTVGVLSIEPADCEIAGDLQDLVLLLALAVGQSTARRQADHQRQQAEFLLQLSEVAAASGSLTETLGEICQHVASYARMNRACLHLVEGDIARPRMASYADGHVVADEWAQFNSAPGSIRITDAVLATGHAQTAESPDSPLIAGWWAETFGLGSALAVPVGTGSDITGVLVLDDPAPRTFSAELIRLVTAVGGHVDTMIARAAADDERAWQVRALASMRSLLQQGAQTSSVRETGVLLARVATEAFDTEQALFVQQDHGMIVDLVGIGLGDETIERLRAGLIGEHLDRQELWNESVERASPVLVDASDDRARPPGILDAFDGGACAVLPLSSGEAPLGVVHVGSSRRTWRVHHRRLAEQLTLEAKLVIDNTRLRQQDRARLAELAHNSTHDALTGLPNRALFQERIGQAFKQRRGDDHQVGLLFVDLDRFKQVNDTVGHVLADELLRQMAQRLRGCVREEDTVARFAGDEFVILLPHVVGMAAAERVAQRVGRALAEAFTAGEHTLHVTASVGIACARPDASDATQLVQAADMAMFRAKHRGRAGYAIDRA